MRDLGRYRVDATIGSGGMATVFLAEDRELGRPVAIKLLADNLAADPVFRDRFLREAQMAARLSHPNIVHVYDIGSDDDGRPYIVMEYVDGESLAETLARTGPLPAERVVEIARDCCAGLSYAHAAGLVHRDIKPHNLLADRDGGVKVADFGVARSLDGVPITKTGSVLGTAGYLSPEQAGGQQVTPATDVYALGVTLHQLLIGHVPDPEVSSSIGGPLRGVITRCLDPDPAARPSAAEMGAALQSGAGPSPTRILQPRQQVSRYPARRRVLERPRELLVATLVVLAVGIAALVATSGGGSSTPAPQTRHHHRSRAAVASPAPGPTAADQATSLADWLRRHAG